MCSDVTGCKYQITRFAYQENAGDASYPDGYIRQVRYNANADEWYDSVGNNKGINGDGVGNYFDSDIWNNAAEFADDAGTFTTEVLESSSDSFVFHDNSATYAFVINICDF